MDKRNVVACMRCGKKANLIHEGVENCTYLCSVCAYEFIIHWDGSSEPQWPISKNEARELRNNWNKLHSNIYVCDDCGEVYSIKPKACKCEKFPATLGYEEFYIVNMDTHMVEKVESSIDTIRNMGLEFTRITKEESEKLKRTNTDSGSYLIVENFHSGIETMDEYYHEIIKIEKPLV